MSPNPAAVLKRDDGSFDCNNGAWVWWQDCQEGLNTLYAMGGGYSQCAVDGGGQNKCTRFSCSWNCGMLLCSRVGFFPFFLLSALSNEL